MPFASRISGITQVILALSNAIGQHHNAITQDICDGEAAIGEKGKVTESDFAVLFLVERNCTDLPELDSLDVARL